MSGAMESSPTPSQPARKPIELPADAKVAAVGESLPLRVNFSWMFVANVVYAGCQWGMLSVLAKLGTPTMVGQFVLALAISTPVMALFMFQLRLVQATDTHREYRFGDYFALRLITSALALAVIIGIGAFGGYRRPTALVLIAVGVSACIDSVNDVVYGLLQQRERMDRFAQSMIMKGLLSLAGFTVTLLATGEVLFGILAVAASRLIVLLAWDFPNASRILRERPDDRGSAAPVASRLVPNWNREKLLNLTRTSLPLGFVMMLIVLSSAIPRYVVEQHLGEHLLGIFGAISFLGLAGIMAVGALGESATARLAEYYASRRLRSFCILLLKLSIFGAALGIAGVAMAIVAGKPILAIVYGPEYAAHSDILVWTMVAAGISYVVWFVNHSVTAVRFFRSQLPLHILAAAATLGVCWWLIPRYGLLGAALSLCVTAIVQLAGAGVVILYALWIQARLDAG